MLILGAAMFGMFYFLTFFVQGVMGFSPLKTGVAFLPFCASSSSGSGIVGQILPRIGPKPLAHGRLGAHRLPACSGSPTVDADTSYWTQAVPADDRDGGRHVAGLRHADVDRGLQGRATDAGLASALLNVGQQVGGSIGLAVLATAFASASKSEGNAADRQRWPARRSSTSGSCRQRVRPASRASPAAYADHSSAARLPRRAGPRRRARASWSPRSSASWRWWPPSC